ncbi:hypothetical protein ATK36_6153 [Amycolatopsis sulphurea]|uniref:Uncharacterized protein n=1 Tax=Amycolatopsis sulphurea TaxID=76022 RepID=A0A2A9FHP4_9PSEU|nr:hypothetical protein ATK36_6153 [Amycolatopsis sulphurea]
MGLGRVCVGGVWSGVAWVGMPVAAVGCGDWSGLVRVVCGRVGRRASGARVWDRRSGQGMRPNWPARAVTLGPAGARGGRVSEGCEGALHSTYLRAWWGPSVRVCGVVELAGAGTRGVGGFRGVSVRCGCRAWWGRGFSGGRRARRVGSVGLGLGLGLGRRGAVGPERVVPCGRSVRQAVAAGCTAGSPDVTRRWYAGGLPRNGDAVAGRSGLSTEDECGRVGNMRGRACGGASCRLLYRRRARTPTRKRETNSKE